MFPAPFPDSAAVLVACELQQAAQTVLMLDRLKQEGIARKLGDAFVEGRVQFEQLLAHAGVQAGVIVKIQVLQPHPIHHRHIRTEAGHQKTLGFDQAAEFVARLLRFHVPHGRHEGPVAAGTPGDQSVALKLGHDVAQGAAVHVIAAAQISQ